MSSFGVMAVTVPFVLANAVKRACVAYLPEPFMRWQCTSCTYLCVSVHIYIYNMNSQTIRQTFQCTQKVQPHKNRHAASAEKPHQKNKTFRCSVYNNDVGLLLVGAQSVLKPRAVQCAFGAAQNRRHVLQRCIENAINIASFQQTTPPTPRPTSHQRSSTQFP